MIIYIISLILSLILAIIIYKNDFFKKDQIYLIMMFFILCFISSFRNYNVGTDTLAYIENFIQLNTTFKSVSIFDLPMEPLFNLLNRVTYTLNDHPQAILFTTSFIINILVALRIYNSSKYPWLSVYLYISLYIFYQSFNGVRQYIAIAIIFYISKYIYERKLIKFILGIIIASGFHISALIFLPCYIFNKVNLNRKNIFLFLLYLSL